MHFSSAKGHLGWNLHPSKCKFGSGTCPGMIGSTALSEPASIVGML